MVLKRDKSEAWLSKARTMFEEKAEQIASSKEQLIKLLKQVGEKLLLLTDHPQIKGLKEQVLVVVRMLKAHYEGRFHISKRSLILMTVGLLYFLMPLDIIPDFLPIIGFADDASVLLAVFKSIQSDVERFVEWERINP